MKNLLWETHFIDRKFKFIKFAVNILGNITSDRNPVGGIFP